MPSELPDTTVTSAAVRLRKRSDDNTVVSSVIFQKLNVLLLKKLKVVIVALSVVKRNFRNNFAIF